MSLARNATASQSPTQTNGYERHQPDQTLLYQLVEQRCQPSKPHSKPRGQHLPRYIRQDSTTSSNVAVWSMVSCGFAARIVITSVWSPSAVNDAACPSCGARRMAESAALLIDEVFPRSPFASGCSAFLSSYAFCWLAIPS